jgi:hypothetical protein
MTARCSLDTTPSAVLSPVPSIQAVAQGYQTVSLRQSSTTVANLVSGATDSFAFIHRAYIAHPYTLNTTALGTHPLSSRASSAWITSPTSVSRNTRSSTRPQAHVSLAITLRALCLSPNTQLLTLCHHYHHNHRLHRHRHRHRTTTPPPAHAMVWSGARAHGPLHVVGEITSRS